MMDISPVGIMPDLPLPLPQQPFSPFVRLAHRSRAAHGGQGLLRRLSDWEIVLVTTGRMWWWAEELGQGCWQRSGEVALIPPGFVHAYGFDASEHLAVHFDLIANPACRQPDQIEAIGGPRPRPRADEPWWFQASSGERVAIVRSIADPQRMEARLRELVALDAVDHGRRGGLHRARSAALVLACFAEVLADSVADDADPRIMHLLARTAPVHVPSVPEMAATCGLSANAFRVAFQRTTGEAPHRYFERRRIETARELLRETDLSIAAIAESVGYDDPYHFSRVVKRVTGQSPSSWRSG